MGTNDGARRRRAAAGLLALGAAALGLAPGSPAQAVADPAPVEHAEVVAQTLIGLEGGEVEWSVSRQTLDAAGGPLAFDRPMFLVVADGSPLLVHGSDGIDVLLAGGEAVFRPAGSNTETRSLGTAVTEAAGLGLGSPGADGSVGEPFVPGAGNHDLDVLHDTLDAGETLSLRSEVPVLVYVARGVVGVGPASANLAAGESTTSTGDVIVENTASDAPASVFVAVIGPTLDLTAPTTTVAASTTPPPTTLPPTTAAVTAPTSTPGASTSLPAPAPASAPPSAPPSTAPPSSTAPPTTAPPPSTTPPPTNPPDSDGDGITDSDEEAYGTNPGLFDTDGDGLGDGEEILVYGTNPTDWDTNDNGLADPN